MHVLRESQSEQTLLKILIVDDNPSDVELLREAFRELHSRAILVVARDGEECLEMLLSDSALSSANPDLIFLDLGLPTISGYDVLRKIKTDIRTRHIPVIVLSSARADEDVERAYEAHANAYVQKPTTLEDLMTAARGLKSFWMETARLAGTFSGH